MFSDTLALEYFTVQNWVKVSKNAMQPETVYLNKSRKDKNTTVRLYDTYEKYLNELFANSRIIWEKIPTSYISRNTLFL